MIWFLAVVDLAAGAYLLVYAHRRERQDKPGVLAVGLTLVVCAELLGGLGSKPNSVNSAALARTRAWSLVVFAIGTGRLRLDLDHMTRAGPAPAGLRCCRLSLPRST